MKPEILAPAGDLERLKIALLYGADAVYLGGSLFGLRANAVNFSIDDIKEGVIFAHKLNKKVYVTVNILLHNKEAKLLIDYLKELDKIGVDAIIVSDLTVLNLAKKYTSIPIHISTQQSTLNYEAAKLLKKLGASRIVYGRELSEQELKKIKDEVDIEHEIFIHGAMCASYSGRCVLSNYLTKRDANRGGCSQICRWDFDLKHDDLPYEAPKNFTFCSKDLSLLKVIPNIIDLGITSLKIEGRMRSSYYLATVVSIYRKVVDGYCSNKENYTYNKNYEKVLDRVANRDSCVQFFDGYYGKDTSYYNNRIEVSNQDFLGIVKAYDKENKIVTIEQRNYFKKGDEVAFFGPNKDDVPYVIDQIYDEDGNEIDIVRHPKQVVKMPIPFELEENDFMKIAVDKH